MRLRRAKQTDEELLFHWSNDAITRAMSFSTERITRQDHRLWLQARLPVQPACLYIAELIEPVGVVQFQIIHRTHQVAYQNKAYEVGIQVECESRGQGLARTMIELATELFFEQYAENDLYARIKLENVKSLKAFQKAGFRALGLDKVGEVECSMLVKSRIKT